MICLSCQQTIKDDSKECPYCHVKYNAEKLRFIKYLGDENSLVGYQKSYKLILLKNIFEFILSGAALSVDSIMHKVKAFYLKRVQNGLPADYDVDSRIRDISQDTGIYDIWAVFKANPYYVINNQGFLFLEKNDKGELVFVLLDDIIDGITTVECQNIIDLLGKKIKLYYLKHDGENEHTVEDKVEVNTYNNKLNNDNFVQLNTTEETKRVLLLDELELSPRAKNCLRRAGCITVQDILKLNSDDLLNIRNLGQKTLKEITNFIANFSDSNYTNNKIIEEDVNCLLQDTGLSIRSKNILIREGYNFVGDILSLTEEQVSSFCGVGQFTLNEILNFVERVRLANGLEATQNNSPISVLENPIKSVELSNHAKNILMNNGYQSVGDVLKLTAFDICSLAKAGTTAINEILVFTADLKQKLSDELSEDERLEYGIIKYPYFAINSECEQIPITVMTFFGFTHTMIRKLQGYGINNLGLLKSMDYSKIRIVMGEDLIKLLSLSLNEFSSDIICVTKIFLDKVSSECDLSFIVERSHGATLQELGNKNSLTKEGVRQTIEKPLRHIKPVAVNLVRVLTNKLKLKFLVAQDIYDLFENNEFAEIILYALKESEEIEYIQSLDIFLISKDQSYEDLLKTVIRDYVGDGIFWKEHIDQLLEILIEKGLDFIDVEDVWLYMLGLGYKVYGEYVAPKTVQTGMLLAMIVDKEFPEGISFSDEEEFKRLRECSYKLFGDLKLPDDNRSLFSRLDNYLVLCDRGRWISPHRIVVDIETLNTIKDYIDNEQDNNICYQSLFNQFAGLLAMTSNISNYYYLHGVLRYYYGDVYTFSGSYLRKGDDNVSGRLSNRINQYIKDKGEAVSRDELKKYLKITSDVMIINVMLNNSDIFQWEFNYYNCLANITITQDESDFLIDIVKEIFSINKNYCSAKMAYDYCCQLLPEMLDRNKVKSSTNLFYLMAIILDGKYKFRCPHILPKDSPLSSSEEIARTFVKKTKMLKRDEFIEMTDQYGWGQSTAGVIFDNIVKNDYIRISRSDYILKEEFIVPENKIYEIKSKMESAMSNKEFLANWEINLKLLPDIGFDWNPHLLAAIVGQYIGEYRFITPNFGICKTERGIYVPVYSKLQSFDEIVVEVMRRTGKNSLTENEMYNALVIGGVIKYTVPKELRESDLISYRDGIYTIKESI
jgi:DNA-directed RNA polymerase alpha subunit